MKDTKYFYNLWKEAVIKAASALKTGDRDSAEQYQQEIEHAYGEYLKCKEQENIVSESVKTILKEYGETHDTRSKIAATANRALRRGNTDIYQDAINTIDRNNFVTPEDREWAMNDFQREFEKGSEELNTQPSNTLATEGVGRKQIRMSESDLHRVVRESVNRILTRLV